MREPIARQDGAVAAVVAIGLVALIAMVGLAIDTGHLGLSKSRLQAAVDAAALAAAKKLDETDSEALASAAGRAVFDLNAANYPELQGQITGADLDIQFSEALSPFTPGATNANYVRVVAADFQLWSGFVRLVGVDALTTAASAVAGPSAPIGVNNACNLAPITVCADLSAGAGGNWGYSNSAITLLKIATGTGGPGSPIGPGNFQLIELGQSGADQVRQNLAGGGTECGVVGPGSTITTKTGNNVGPVAQGLNTRFNQYQGPVTAAEYPPDVIITENSPLLESDGTNVYFGMAPMGPMGPMGGGGGTLVTDVSDIPFSHADYVAALANEANYITGGRHNRRYLKVPISDCSTMVNGHGTLPVVDVGCFFLLQQAEQAGTQNYIYGQYIGQCAGGGSPGPAPGTGMGPGVYKIVLHNDPNSGDS